MKYDKFDYDLYKAGRKVVTRDGREVTQLTKFEVNQMYCLAGVIDKEFCTFAKDGLYLNEDISYKDLFLLPEERKVYFLLGDIEMAGWKEFNDAFRSTSEYTKHIVEYKTTGDETTLKIVHTFPSKS